MPQKEANYYHAQLGPQDKGRTIKELVVCNDWDLEPLDLLNGLALGCYPSTFSMVWLPKFTARCLTDYLTLCKHTVLSWVLESSTICE